jgi:hypothetical protein
MTRHQAGFTTAPAPADCGVVRGGIVRAVPRPPLVDAPAQLVATRLRRETALARTCVIITSESERRASGQISWPLTGPMLSVDSLGLA